MDDSGFQSVIKERLYALFVSLDGSDIALSSVFGSLLILLKSVQCRFYLPNDIRLLVVRI